MQTPQICALRNTRGAFTLIELLIVITIMAIIAAMLFPVFARAREKSRQISCAGNLRQTGSAFQMYAADNDEVNLPYIVWSGGIDYHWEILLQPYLHNRQVFLCPDAPDKSLAWEGHRPELHHRFKHYYGMNLVGRDPPLSADFVGNLCMSRFEGVDDAAVEDPSGTIWVIDSYPQNRVDYDPTDADMGQNMGTAYLIQGRMAKRHNGTANALFVDGHVKALARVTPAMWTRSAD